jgi:hypothetical protein
MSAADFGVAVAVPKPPRATVANAIRAACTDINALGVEDDRGDQAKRLDSTVSVRGVISALGQAMIEASDRIAAAGVLSDAIREIDKHIAASRTELLAHDT